jgi:hypothetical protein
METELLTKKDFAARVNVTPARVSQWLKEGKLDPEALEGDGRRAKVRVNVALGQLRARLDPNQRYGLNGLATDLNGQADPPAGDTIEHKIQRQKLRQAELQTAKLEEDEARRAGELMRTADAEAVMVRLADQMLQVFEGALPDLAGALAQKFELSNRDVVHLLKKEFRQVRQKASDAAAKEAAGIDRTLAA